MPKKKKTGKRRGKKRALRFYGPRISPTLLRARRREASGPEYGPFIPAELLARRRADDLILAASRRRKKKRGKKRASPAQLRARKAFAAAARARAKGGSKKRRTTNKKRPASRKPACRPAASKKRRSTKKGHTVTAAQVIAMGKKTAIKNKLLCFRKTSKGRYRQVR